MREVGGACVVGLGRVQSSFHSLLFRGVSWTVVFGLTGEFIWKELKRIGVEDLNNLWG